MSMKWGLGYNWQFMKQREREKKEAKNERQYRIIFRQNDRTKLYKHIGKKANGIRIHGDEKSDSHGTFFMEVMITALGSFALKIVTNGQPLTYNTFELFDLVYYFWGNITECLFLWVVQTRALISFFRRSSLHAIFDLFHFSDLTTVLPGHGWLSLNISA